MTTNTTNTTPESDTGTHLLGSAKFIALASSFATQGGLGEAASWVVLRQNLYVSLAMSTPLRLDWATTQILVPSWGRVMNQLRIKQYCSVAKSLLALSWESHHFW